MSEHLLSDNSASEWVADSIHLPMRVVVKEILDSRYPPDHNRPDSWDDRLEGLDLVQTDFGQIKLLSDGGQSPPKSGWVILLTGGDNEKGFFWTLYGIQRPQLRN
jgi:hypothetical protein